jgi:hypothetical protein
MNTLSVDVDLTYLPIEDRLTFMANINAALHRIKHQIEAFLPDVFVQHKQQETKLVVSNRPVVEMLFPNYKNQKHIFDNQFAGMTYEPFTYSDFENTRALLIQKIHTLLTIEDKQFLLSVENGTPNWEIYDFRSFPAMQWKLLNVRRLKAQNPAKHKEIYSQLELKLL